MGAGGELGNNSIVSPDGKKASGPVLPPREPFEGADRTQQQSSQEKARLTPPWARWGQAVCVKPETGTETGVGICLTVRTSNEGSAAASIPPEAAMAARCMGHSSAMAMPGKAGRAIKAARINHRPMDMQLLRLPSCGFSVVYGPERRYVNIFEVFRP